MLVVAIVLLTLSSSSLALQSGFVPTTRSGSPSTFFSGDRDDIQDYLDWVDTVDYQGSHFLSSSKEAADGAAIHWNIDQEHGILELAIAVHATGWLGFGISDNGGMLGSDMLVFESLNPTTVKDYHVTDSHYPELDECPSWEFVSSLTNTGFLIVEVRRKLDTNDSQDWPIILSSNANSNSSVLPIPQPVIAAWGDSPSMGYHGVKNARSAIQWLRFGQDEVTSFRDVMATMADGSFKFVREVYHLPADAITYNTVCFTTDDIKAQGVPLDDGVTLIGIQPIITLPSPHHYILRGSHDCVERSIDIVYNWVPGECPLTFPDGVGITLGGNTGYNSFTFSYHYDNMEKRTDLYDSGSGAEFFYSIKPPIHEAGIWLIYSVDQNHPVGKGLTQHTVECKASCTETFLTQSGLIGPSDDEEDYDSLSSSSSITVFREKLHMHKLGYSAFLEQYRVGQGLIRTERAQYYDYSQQGSHTIIQQEPYEIKAGDSFKLGCFYKDDSDDEHYFGHTSSDEMCYGTMLYYPKKLMLAACKPEAHGACKAVYEKVQNSSLVKASLDKTQSFGRNDFKKATCPAPLPPCPLFAESGSKLAPLLPPPFDESGSKELLPTVIASTTILVAVILWLLYSCHRGQHHLHVLHHWQHNQEGNALV